MNNIYAVKETALTNEKKPLVLVLLYLGSISLQTRIKLKKSLKNIVNCCKLQTVFNNKIRLGNNFHLKGSQRSYFLCVCNESYFGECVRKMNDRISVHIGISLLTKKEVKPKNSSVANHLLFCNHSAYYDDFSILTRQNENVLLELKESLLKMRVKPSFNRNITSVPFYTYDRALL